MATRIVVPREGQSMETATIVKWDVSVGDEVKFGDVLCEAESEKASFDIESAVSGKVLAVLFPEGSEVPVLSTIAIVGKDGEDISGMTDSAPEEVCEAAEEAPEEESAPIETAAPSEPAPEAGERRRISPRAFKLALDNNVPIEEISADPIIEADVIAYLEAREKAAQAPAAVYAPVPLTMHYRAKADVLARYTALLNSSPLSDIELAVGDMVAYAAAQTLKALNMDSDMEFARAEGEALAASTIANSAALSLYGIAEAAASPCNCTLPAPHLGICDFASLGAYAAIPNLKEGEWGALGIGRIVLESVRTEKGVEHVDMLPLSLTVDTAAMDTAAAAKFMRVLVANIEHIDMLTAR